MRAIWNYENIKKSIMDCMKELDIDRIPTKSELQGFAGGGVIQAIQRRGGMKVMAHKMGLSNKKIKTANTVYMYDENYNLIKSYPTAQELSRSEGVTRYKVDLCLHDSIEFIKINGNNCIVSFKENLKKSDRIVNKKREYGIPRPVWQYKDGVLVAKHSSAESAAKATGFKKRSIQAVCNSKYQSTLFGYVFSYTQIGQGTLEPVNVSKFTCINQRCPLNRNCVCMSEHVSTGKADCASKNKITDKPKKLSADERYKLADRVM